MFIYKDKVLNEPGNVDFGSEDISGIGDGTVTGAIKSLNSKIDNASEIVIENEHVTDSIIAYKKNGVCMVTYSSDWKPVSAGDLGLIGILPSGYRPPYSVTTMLSPYLDIQVRINEHGEILAYNYGSGYDSNFPGRFLVTYPVS